ncbi:N-acyl-phosphatidylethanolamine-hydrolyzing phospholipase D isoform X1 [Octopus sinensis]|uniref:N-acetylphosphatidylethanolamine-hydrolyzing phospholipase D n=2 Tax=Octopus sinensis TaxID=2607531 RepID=A0A6P7TJQ2_9MOLL|nr:N-acyl-phosphatidylethanolamine-hydrolyzing phospholipase D isoform X1 [Octopus sinensis]
MAILRFTYSPLLSILFIFKSKLLPVANCLAFEDDGDTMAASSTDKLFKPVYKNGVYDNPFPTWRNISFWNVIKWLVTTKDNSNVPSKAVLDRTLPVITPDLQELADPPKEGIRYMWLGHATTLVQLDGVTILTDPVFSERCSFVQFAGPKRFRPLPLSISDLPRVDVVLISHNHYDHLDYDTVVALREKFGAKLTWFVPAGNGRWMRETGRCKNVKELSWWESSEVPDHPEVRIVCTPCQHWSRRGVNDTNRALWSSWSVLGPTQNYFFTGDTGYCAAFKQIGAEYGPFSLAAIPIGSFEPRWMMRPQHVDPAEAVLIHQDIRSKQSFGIHWGTFKLASEFYMAPKEKLKSELESKKVSETEFFTVKHGEIHYVRAES